MLGVFDEREIRNALLALASAGELQGPEYHKALHDVALAFGVQPLVLQRWRVVDSSLAGVGNEATHFLYGAKTTEASKDV